MKRRSIMNEIKQFYDLIQVLGLRSAIRYKLGTAIEGVDFHEGGANAN